MKSKVTMVIRILLGLLFTASGIMGLLNLIPPPPDLPPALITFNQGLMASVYFMPLLKSVETICGLLLITNFFVPLALVVLAPVVINIFCVHAFLAPSGLPLALVIGIFMIYLSFFAEPYKNVIKQLFRPKA
jgi:uncharacterized membrane protein YphA (DoxX/SURF4 family)